MTQQDQDSSPEFVGLIMSLANSAMISMGKVPNPVSGEVELDLQEAQQTIDLIRVLQLKTEGNLEPDEENLLDSTLTNLRLTYVNEAKKASERTSSDDSGAEAGS